ncbi:unnamed protein product [Prorocentrum cordatum]|uniref:Protein kinase domain-containing protein n=1 Tax=Prorocentrum cordatum TaxID=2364126 RepID=A0ABN9Y2W7_9DINO|nr:unnamed protein product [Polarella glacialis]
MLICTVIIVIILNHMYRCWPDLEIYDTLCAYVCAQACHDGVDILPGSAVTTFMTTIGGPFKVVQVKGRGGISKFTVPEPWDTIGLLGSGAYATVAAFRIGQHDRYAVKKIERVFDHPVLALRTLREVKLLQHFQHPNILNLRQFYVDGPDFKDTYLCLEMMDSDLHSLISMILRTSASTACVTPVACSLCRRASVPRWGFIIIHRLPSSPKTDPPGGGCRYIPASHGWTSAHWRWPTL